MTRLNLALNPRHCLKLIPFGIGVGAGLRVLAGQPATGDRRGVEVGMVD